MKTFDIRGGLTVRSVPSDGYGEGKALAGFGRYAGPATLILSSLGDGAKHGYALTKDVESFAGVRLPLFTAQEPPSLAFLARHLVPD